jgi:RimJ/RimL family protein N-acetyltransferase
MIVLEKFTQDDFDRFISWIKSEEQLVQFAGPLFKYPLSYEQLNNYLNQNKKTPYRIKLQETNEVIGHCELNFENDIPRLSRILIGEKQLRNKGIGKQVVRAMIDIVFNTTDYSAIDLSVFDWNHNAIACYQKLGFTIRTELQTSMIVSEKIWNTQNMILNKADYIELTKKEQGLAI